ncbi:MAG TPA: amino acid ABC transporter ATP-binding protein [Chthoniobacterales bacterium]
MSLPIYTHELHKKYGDLHVLRGISVDIPENQTVCVLGPSGSGKSTFIRCLNLLEVPTEGVIRLGNVEITDPKVDLDAVRMDAGMVFQHFNLFPHLTVLRNITLAPMKVRKIPKAEAEETALTLLEKVGLKEKANVYPSQLSGGQKQRVAIARALAMKPKILLFDEPTSALDPEMVGGVLNVIKSLAGTITSVIVTHEMNFARDVADRILFMDGGYVVEDLPPTKFFSNPTTARARQFLGEFCK